MECIFKYDGLDRRAHRITAVSTWILAFVGLLCLAWYIWGGGGYALAWYVLLAIAIIGLFVISIPRSIEVSGSALEIKCLVEVTYIPLSNLRSIRRVDAAELKGVICLAGSPGFLGYYGIWLDAKQRELVKVYCTEWDNLVEITDTFGKRYYVNCSRADELVACVGEAAHTNEA